MVMPGVVRKASLSVVASLSPKTSCVSTVTLRGVLTIGSGNFDEASRSAL
jgi:hypothetical protein